MSRDMNYGSDSSKLRKYTEAYTMNTSELKGEQLEKVINDRIPIYADIYYFSKHPDWKEENEYRFLIKNAENQELYIEIDGILENIIMGTKADPMIITLNLFIENILNLGFTDVKSVQILKDDI